MSTGLKLFKALNDIDESFLEDPSENKISKKAYLKKNKVNLIKKFLSVACVVALLLISVLINNKDKVNYIKENEEYINVISDDELVLNEYIPAIPDLANVEESWKDEDIIGELEIHNRLNLPSDFNVIRQGRIYIKEKNKDEKNKFQEYRLVFGENQRKDKYIEIDFSKDLLLKKIETENYISETEHKVNISTISGVKVKIFTIKSVLENEKIKGVAYLEYNNYKIRIEVSEITTEQFIKLIKSTIETFETLD